MISSSNPSVPDVQGGTLASHRVDRPSEVLSRVAETEPEAPPATTKKPTLLRDLGTVLLIFLAWRGMLFGADYVGRSLSVPLTQELHYHASRFWDGYIRHDSLHYARVIREGYLYETQGPWRGLSTNAAFFPLYPYTVKAITKTRIPGVGRLFRSIWPAGLVLSNVCLVLSLVYMLRIARLYLDEEAAHRSLVYLLTFPTSFFFSTFYTESLFLLTTTASFYHFLNGKHLRSGCWGLLACTCRSPGIVLMPAFVLGHLWSRRFRISRSDLSLLWLGLIPCGLAIVMGIMYTKLGDPFAFSKAQVAWGRSFTMPYRTLWNAITQIHWSLPYGNFGNTFWACDVVMSLVFLALPFFLLRGFHKALPIYSLLLILMPLTTGITAGMSRYAVVAFPAFFVLARFGEKRAVDRWIVFSSSLLLCLLKIAFSNGFMVI